MPHTAMAFLLCERCERLLEEYRDATTRVVQASKRLSSVAISQEYDLFRRWWEDANAAHLECEKARKSFLAHLKCHDSP